MFSTESVPAWGFQKALRWWAEAQGGGKLCSSPGCFPFCRWVRAGPVRGREWSPVSSSSPSSSPGLSAVVLPYFHFFSMPISFLSLLLTVPVTPRVKPSWYGVWFFKVFRLPLALCSKCFANLGNYLSGQPKCPTNKGNILSALCFFDIK